MDTGDGPDTRFEFMGSFVQKTLKLKPEKWLRLTTVEEHKNVLKEFLDRTHPVVLIIILTQSAQIVPSTSFPLTQLKSKGIFNDRATINEFKAKNVSLFNHYLRRDLIIVRNLIVARPNCPKKCITLFLIDCLMLNHNSSVGKHPHLF